MQDGFVFSSFVLKHAQNPQCVLLDVAPTFQLRNWGFLTCGGHLVGCRGGLLASQVRANPGEQCAGRRERRALLRPGHRDSLRGQPGRMWAERVSPGSPTRGAVRTPSQPWGPLSRPPGPGARTTIHRRRLPSASPPLAPTQTYDIRRYEKKHFFSCAQPPF